jgi:uncharacterized protein YciW
MFNRAARAARFDGFLASTATPYAWLMVLILARHRLCNYYTQKLSWRMNHSRRSSSVMSASAAKPSK